ncbi:OmpH family outer membrane protein [Candidatus Binatia bacterium]|nr:OmpH family outer membrane protein [Candidatus Binatia bacterium]
MKAMSGGRAVLAATLLVFLCVPGLAAAADVKIGYVDLQRALNESAAGKKAKEDFRGQVDRLEGQLKGKKEELDKLKSDLETKGTVMADAQRKKLETEFEQKRLDLKRRFEDSQQELQKKDQELTGKIIQDLQGIIKEVGDRDGYTLILELGSSPVLYYKKSADITDDVLSVYNGRK